MASSELHVSPNLSTVLARNQLLPLALPGIVVAVSALSRSADSARGRPLGGPQNSAEPRACAASLRLRTSLSCSLSLS
eukprot:scaffold387_cov244-Pinguiococcus_pyrenoidosus.AAC.3